MTLRHYGAIRRGRESHSRLMLGNGSVLMQGFGEA